MGDWETQISEPFSKGLFMCAKWPAGIHKGWDTRIFPGNKIKLTDRGLDLWPWSHEYSLSNQYQTDFYSFIIYKLPNTFCQDLWRASFNQNIVMLINYRHLLPIHTSPQTMSLLSGHLMNTLFFCPVVNGRYSVSLPEMDGFCNKRV